MAESTMNQLTNLFFNSYPATTALLNNLNGMDLINLYRAGVNTNVSRGVLRTHLPFLRCRERPNGVRCTNTTWHRVQINDCVGFRIEPNVIPGAAPQHSANGLWPKLGYSRHGYRHAVCLPCRRFFRNQHRIHEVRLVLAFKVQLCKRHRTAFWPPDPQKRCKCYRFMRGYWRCDACARATKVALGRRGCHWRNDLIHTRVESGKRFTRRKRRGRGKRVIVDPTYTRVDPACPIKGCGQKPFKGTINDQDVLSFCMGCCRMQR